MWNSIMRTRSFSIRMRVVSGGVTGLSSGATWAGCAAASAVATASAGNASANDRTINEHGRKARPDSGANAQRDITLCAGPIGVSGLAHAGQAQALQVVLAIAVACERIDDCEIRDREVRLQFEQPIDIAPRFLAKSEMTERGDPRLVGIVERRGGSCPARGRGPAARGPRPR